MRASNAVRATLIDTPLALPTPISTDSVRPGPSYFIVPTKDPANTNSVSKKRSAGDPVTGAVRVASMFGYIGRLIDAFVKGRRPAWESFYAYDQEAFYDHICSAGADIIFLHASYQDLLQRLKLDSNFCDIPVVLIDSWDTKESVAAHERWIRSGAAAVLFVPVMEAPLFKVLDELLLEPKLDD
ncbi:MAG TPA: hypothetical protein VGM59_04960 [Dongiaceae bacterium]